MHLGAAVVAFYSVYDEHERVGYNLKSPLTGNGRGNVFEILISCHSRVNREVGNATWDGQTPQVSLRFRDR
jgi:hypothetical protein